MDPQWVWMQFPLGLYWNPHASKQPDYSMWTESVVDSKAWPDPTGLISTPQ